MPLISFPPPPVTAAWGLALAILAPLPPNSLPVLRQGKAAWQQTIREKGLPPDSVGWLDYRRGVIIILAGQVDEAATIIHEKSHWEYFHLPESAKAEWAAGWQKWGQRMPWAAARQRMEDKGVWESWAYTAEAISPESLYVERDIPVEAVRLYLRLRGMVEWTS